MKISENQIRESQLVLLKNASVLVEHKMLRAIGQEGKFNESTVDKQAQKDVWDVLSPLLQQAKDKEALQAQSTQDITQ